ncbi:helix-turn-helix transcriptional regulator [bacterium]|nr:helix-turn-helix transcriptional regulator [bacterium]
MKEQMESFAFWGYKELGISGKELSRYLGISQSRLSEAIERGEVFAQGKSLTD